MTPGARVQAAIELLAEIEALPRPADGTASAFFRARRFIGSKDRRAVSDTVWGVLRRRARLDWWVRHAQARTAAKRRPEAPEAGPERAARWRILADLVLTGGRSVEGVARLADDNHGPAGLTQEERDVLAAMAGQPLGNSAMPRWVRGEYPEWLEEPLRTRFGGAFPEAMAALAGEASLDLRANLLKCSREEAIAHLAAEGIAAEPTPHSPVGLRVRARVDLPVKETFRNGLVEIQDEGSQVIALLVDARPGMAVCDYCAGAGGKTLALAAGMANKGRLVACDISAGRIDRSAVRLRRAGAHNVTRRVLGSDNDPWVRRSRATFDRVLVDVPCTGTGTWRRNPDAKWRLTPIDVAELVVRQRTILDSAARLVKPGGRLIYATCSLLPEENDRQIEGFLAANPIFRLLPAVEAWGGAVGNSCPFDGEGGMARLSPLPHGTDGYFVAVMVAEAGSQP